MSQVWYGFGGSIELLVLCYLNSLADKILLTVRTNVGKYSIRGAIVPTQSVDVVVADRIPVAVDEPVVHVVPVIPNAAVDREYNCTVHKTGFYL